MNLTKLFPNITGDEKKRESGEPSAVGTVAEPTLVDGLTRVPTGRNAVRSQQSLFKRLTDTDDQTIALPVNSRAQRRARAAGEARSRRKGRRAFVRQELAKEREANQLAQLFNIVDNRVPASMAVWGRANAALEARKEFLADQEPEISEIEIESRLRAVAKVAPVKTPKVKLAAELIPSDHDPRLTRVPVDLLTTGRTGRAG